MKKIALAICALLMPLLACAQGKADEGITLPAPLLEFAGGERTHVQGIAADLSKGELYFSFTTRFVRTDLHGNVLGSIDRIQGHLGAMTFNPLDGCVYASLECKDDEIGRGVAKTLGAEVVTSSHFYVAIIDVAKVDRIGIDPEGDPVLRTVCLAEPALDYNAEVLRSDVFVAPDYGEGLAFGHEPHMLKHRYGCAGIDAVSFAPAPGRAHRKAYSCGRARRAARRLGRLSGPVGAFGDKWFYAACGVYGDTTRTDNNHQILLRYRTSDLRKYARTISFGTLHESGPAHPFRKYFVHTGNTTYGVQNMACDPLTGYMLLAVYRGRKGAFPNYTHYAVDMGRRAHKGSLEGVPYQEGKVLMLSLAEDGLQHAQSGIRGWEFPWGSTGLYPLGEGLWLISEPKGDPVTHMQFCRLHLMRWTGNADEPFVQVGEPGTDL